MVSIIMPAFNCEKFLEESVKSVINQTYTEWNLIIIDDSSTDQTSQLADMFAASDDRIKVIHNERNVGVGSSRNRGVKETFSEWIAFLDSDDLWDPEKLEKQIRFSQRNPEAALIYTASSFITEAGTKIDYILHVPSKINRRKLLKQNLISCSSVLVKRDLLLEHPMPTEGELHEDFATWLDILCYEPYAYGIDEPLLTYRVSAGSKSGNKIKAASMNWNTYKRASLSNISVVYNMFWYMYKGTKKYRRLREKK